MLHDRYTLTELTEAANVSVRTVRYYISEGLLPPPVDAGPRSHYTTTHLDRLLLIGRLKASYLPLREIRRHLAGLDDADVHRLVVEPDVDAASPAVMESVKPLYLDPANAPAHTAERPRDSAATYISRVMTQASRYQHQPAEPDDPWRKPPQPAIGRVAFAPPNPADSSPSAWRRVPLGDDAELLIREEAYTRKRDRVDWLIRWARKVFG